MRFEDKKGIFLAKKCGKRTITQKALTFNYCDIAHLKEHKI